MKDHKIEAAEIGRAKFLKITKSFDLEATEKSGAAVRLRLPLEALHAMLYAAEEAEAKGYIREDELEREGMAAIAPVGLEVVPATDSGLMLTFELRSGKKVMFQIVSYASSETLRKAARQIADGLSLATASQRN